MAPIPTCLQLEGATKEDEVAVVRSTSAWLPTDDLRKLDDTIHNGAKLHALLLCEACLLGEMRTSALQVHQCKPGVRGMVAGRLPGCCAGSELAFACRFTPPRIACPSSACRHAAQQLPSDAAPLEEQ